MLLRQFPLQMPDRRWITTGSPGLSYGRLVARNAAEQVKWKRAADGSCKRSRQSCGADGPVI